MNAKVTAIHDKGDSTIVTYQTPGNTISTELKATPFYLPPVVNPIPGD